MSHHTFKIHAPLNPMETKIEIDGKPLKAVRRVEFSISPDDLVEMKLTIVGFLEVDGEFREADLVKVERKAGE